MSGNPVHELARRRAEARRTEAQRDGRLRGLLLGPAALLMPAAVPVLPRIPLTPDLIQDVHQDKHEPATVERIMEYCLARGAIGLVGGYGMGFVFGAMFSGMGTMGTLESVPGGYDPTRQVPAMQALREGFQNMWSRGKSTGKSFAIIGGGIGAIECWMDRARGKTDAKNRAAASAIAGAALAYRGGPKGMIVGALGFATFGLIMDLVMGGMGGEHD